MDEGVVFSLLRAGLQRSCMCLAVELLARNIGTGGSLFLISWQGYGERIHASGAVPYRCAILYLVVSGCAQDLEGWKASVVSSKRREWEMGGREMLEDSDIESSNLSIRMDLSCY